MNMRSTDTIYLSDIVDKCYPESIEPDEFDAEITERIKLRVMDRIGAEKPKRRRKLLRTAVLIAAAAALFTTAAYSAAEFFMSKETVNESISGYWKRVDENGEIEYNYGINFPDAGMVLSFSGPEATANSPEFRAFWLPAESTIGYTDEEGWASYLGDDGNGRESLPYIINTQIVHTGDFKYVLNGKVSVIKEDYWGDWYVLELSSDYSEATREYYYENDTANYIFLFDEERGFLVTISGTSDIETLEHIARELEIRESDQPPYKYEEGFSSNISAIDLSRG